MSRSDDRKMKELVDRLVAMSPEPPPYPEEVSVTQREESSKMRPILVFAGAALVVLLAAGIPLLLARGGGEADPVATSTSTTVASTVTTVPDATTTTGVAPTTTVPPVTTTTETVTTTAAEETYGVYLFLTQTPENSFAGNPALVPFMTNVAAGPDDNPVAVALSTLFNPGLTPPPGFENHVGPGVVVQGVDEPTEGLRVVDLSAEFIDGSGSGALGDFTMLNQLIFTATDDEMWTEVQFTVDGEPVTQFGSEGLDISSPLSRESFLDQVNSVNLETVITDIGDFPTIEGIANVFEATVSLELVDSGGNVVYEDFTTATCGTGCWGDFSFLVDDFDFENNPVTVRVFWHSAEDGSPSDVVSVPTSWGDGGPWDFLP